MRILKVLPADTSQDAQELQMLTHEKH